MSKEIVEDLQCNNLVLVQSDEDFKFGTDAILLADFSKKCRGKNALDLCSGNGIIPILLSGKTNISKLYGIEIQENSYNLFKKSVELNGLSDRVFPVCDDIKNATTLFGKRSFDIITCNPPYMKLGSAVLNDKDSKVIARHEVLCTLEDVIKSASELLSLKGRFFMIHRPTRMAEALACMKKYRIEPKRLRLVFPDKDSEPVLFLVEGLLFGEEEIRIMPPLFIKDESGEESQELKMIYEKCED